MAKGARRKPEPDLCVEAGPLLRLFLTWVERHGDGLLRPAHLQGDRQRPGERQEGQGRGPGLTHRSSKRTQQQRSARPQQQRDLRRQLHNGIGQLHRSLLQPRR